ncbi:hypothetical protein DPEC_G00051160 [Dallia pectoralis]|uniref:Uncharacterized protein n=1 Tax=Dallia pectoralis TaxID=75939 RepID=A0ACC2HC21_DALPE|nr:hypothetical protein DPEC_G00051160 [Dallia pectoralis]
MEVYRYQKRMRATQEHCCVPLCVVSGRYNSTVSFHSFPVEEALRKKWIVNTRRDDFEVKKNTKVCSVHFTPGDFMEGTSLRRLKKGVFPTLFEWNRYQVELPRSSVWERKERHLHSCEETPPPHPDHEYVALPPSLQDQLEEARKTIANRKKAEAQKTGLSSPPSLTPTEEQTLSLNQGRAIVDGIPGGTSSESDTSHDTSGLAKIADGHIVIMEPFAIAQPVTVKVEAEDAPSELKNEHDWSPPENMAGDSYADDPSSSTQILGTQSAKELYEVHLQRKIRKSDMEMELIKHQVEETKLNIKKASLEIELLEHQLKVGTEYA